MSRTYGKAQDLIDFTRASSGTALRRVKYGAELVANGTFDSDSDWAKGTGWTISGGTAVGAATYSYLSQTILTIGKLYSVTYTVGYTSGIIALDSNTSATATNRTSSGTYTEHFIAVSAVFTLRGTNFTGTIDNVSVKEVTFDTSDGDLILFNHPNNIPRIEYDANGNLLGLLVEESRTNLITYSDFSGGWAGKTQVSLALNSATSPTGQQDAITATFSGADPHIFDFLSLTAGNNYVGTVWLKGVGNNIGRSPRVWMVSNTGTVTSVVADTTPLTSEWQRYTTTATCTASGTILFRIDFDDSGSAASGEQVYAFGAQLEEGSFPTSYIPTSGSTATRSADVASLSTSAFGYRQDEGSLVVECENPFLGSGSIIALNEGISGNSNNRIILTMDGSRTNSIFITTGGVGQAGITKEEIVGQPLTKYGASWKENDVAFVRNGGSASTDTSATIPNVISNMDIGFYSGVGRKMTTHIKSLKYIPRRLTNEQLQELTS